MSVMGAQACLTFLGMTGEELDYNLRNDTSTAGGQTPRPLKRSVNKSARSVHEVIPEARSSMTERGESDFATPLASNTPSAPRRSAAATSSPLEIPAPQ